ncbi:hypothetical protein D3C72_2359100 [compost metagenome]
MIGFAIELISILQNITLEQFEDHQLDLDTHAQIASGLEKVTAQHRRCQRIDLNHQALSSQG